MWPFHKKQREDAPPLTVKEYAARIQSVMTIQVPRKAELEYRGERHSWRLLSTFQEGKAVRMTFEVPPGLSAGDLEKHIDAISARIGCPVEFQNNLGSVQVTAFPFDIPTYIPFGSITQHIDPSKGYLIGLDRAGLPVYIQFYEPHILIAGTTGFGKTAFLMLFLTQIVSEHSPEEVQIQIIDLKGTDFIFLEGFPHVRPIVSTLGAAVEALASAHKLMRDRQAAIIRAKREGIFVPDFSTFYLVIDEAATIAPKQQPNDGLKELAHEAESYLSDLARIGRSVGIRIIYCTQYPTAEILNSQIKAVVTQRIVFRLPEAIKSMVALDETGAEDLEVKGRAIYKTSAGKRIVQVPYAPEEEYQQYLGMTNFFSHWRDQDESGNPGEFAGAAEGNADHFDPASVPLLPDDSPLSKKSE